jgi:curli biogenesis system outer membrane secretion channel CsgG
MKYSLASTNHLRGLGRTAIPLFCGLMFLNAQALASGIQPYEGLKKTISVDLFTAAEAVGGSVTAEGLTAMLMDALAKDGRFVVVERPGLSSVQSEQTLATSGAVNAETGAKANQLIGSSAIIKGAVIKYEPAAGGATAGVAGLPMGGLFGSRASVSHKEAVLSISLRLIDTTTGQVISTSTADGTASSNGASADVVSNRTGAAFGGEVFQNTPIGQAAQDAIKKAVDQIAAGMRNVPWTALVVSVNADKIYLNAGADRNVQPGTPLNIYHQGQVLTDPGTGETLDVQIDKIGEAQIESVKPKVSIAILKNGAMPSRGDILKQE